MAGLGERDPSPSHPRTVGNKETGYPKTIRQQGGRKKIAFLMYRMFCGEIGTGGAPREGSVLSVITHKYVHTYAEHHSISP